MTDVLEGVWFLVVGFFAVCVLAFAFEGCAAFQPRGEFWQSDRWGKCAALSVAAGPAQISVHACVRVEAPDAGDGGSDAGASD